MSIPLVWVRDALQGPDQARAYGLPGDFLERVKKVSGIVGMGYKTYSALHDIATPELAGESGFILTLGEGREDDIITYASEDRDAADDPEKKRVFENVLEVVRDMRGQREALGVECVDWDVG